MIKIPIAEPCLGQEELDNVTEAVRSGWVSSRGKFITEFENEFAAFCGTKFGIATSNGTVALHLALAALDLGPGDEVIVPSLTFIATANAVHYTGAKPVFVDVSPENWQIDPEKIEETITEKTKAIIPVHLYGHPCKMGLIMEIARKHHLLVIEDAAEAHGAECAGKKAGSFGDVSCFSFYGNKIITTGEGGMCVTNDKELAGRMRVLRDHGMNPKRQYWHDLVGFNYRMTNLQAALGMAQVARIEEFIEKKRLIASWYADGLRDPAQDGAVVLHPEEGWAKCVYWMYSLLIKESFGLDRDALMAGLAEAGIGTRPFFYPITVMPPYKTEVRFPVSEQLSREGINLPSAVTLEEDQVDYIVGKIKELRK